MGVSELTLHTAYLRRDMSSQTQRLMVDGDPEIRELWTDFLSFGWRDYKKHSYSRTKNMGLSWFCYVFFN